MKKILLISVLLISGLFISAGICNAEIKEGPKVLKVKDLYLGMDIDEGCKVINSLLGTSYVALSKHGTYMITSEEYEKDEYVQDTLSKLGFMITAGSDKKINYIGFAPDIIDKLFNVKGISAEDFVREFIEAYKIPNMEPYGNTGIPGTSSYDPYAGEYGWVFTSSTGYEVKISEAKSLLIEPIAKKSEMKFD